MPRPGPSKPTTSRSRPARQSSNPLTRPNYKDHSSDHDSIDGSDGELGFSQAMRPTPSSYNPLGDIQLSEQDEDDGGGGGEEVAAILAHFNKRTTKHEKAEQKKMINHWQTQVAKTIHDTDQAVEAAKAQVEANLAATIQGHQADEDKTEHYEGLLAQLDEHVDAVIAQLDPAATQLSSKKNSELEMVNAVLSRRAERLELAKHDYDAALDKHAHEQIELARLYARNGPQVLRSLQRVLMA